ncbi:MAG: MaoC family dehydratase [Rickettsiales bacterium]
MRKALYYEDFTVGQEITSSEPYEMSKEAIIAFATEFDPQPMHIDEEGAKNSLFGRLVASGWHTSSATMRLKTQTLLADLAGGLVGMGVESVRWPRPTLPGDKLRLLITILDMRESKSKPDKGIIKYKVETFNQRDELVMEMVTAVIATRRGS